MKAPICSVIWEFRPLIQYGHDSDTGKVYEVLDGLKLKDGFLYKKVSLDSLSFSVFFLFNIPFDRVGGSGSGSAGIAQNRNLQDGANTDSGDVGCWQGGII